MHKNCTHRQWRTLYADELGELGGVVSAVMGDVPCWCFRCAELTLFGVGVDFTASFDGNSG